MYGESCRFVHDGSLKTGGRSEDGDPVRQKVEFGGKMYELENGRIKGPPSHIGVILPQRPANPDTTPIKCGTLITDHQQSCGEVKFSQVSVSHWGGGGW